MHISEGIITGVPAMAYTAASLGLVGYGAKKMKDLVKENPEKKPLLGMAGAFIFFLSLIPIPAAHHLVQAFQREQVGQRVELGQQAFPKPCQKPGAHWGSTGR